MAPLIWGRRKPAARRRLVLPGLGAIVLGLLLAPQLAAYERDERVGAPFGNPDADHPFGTDHLGHDVLSQVLHQAPSTIAIPALATLLLLASAGVLGILVGLAGLRIHNTAMRLLEIAVVLPPLVVVLVIVSLRNDTIGILMAVVVASAGIVTRIVATATRQIADAGHVESARCYGESPLGILRHEILPRIGPLLLAEAGLRLIGAVQVVAALSFLGLVAGSGGSWGSTIREATVGIDLNIWAVLLPCLALTSVLVLFSLIADRSQVRA